MSSIHDRDLGKQSKSLSSEVIFAKKSEGEDKVRVSVVIPVFNGEGTIGAELDALAAQTAGSFFEVVISDNGSTDNTRGVALGWADRFAAFKIIDSGGCKGASFARNEGVRFAEADKILFCDADDIVSPSWVVSLERVLDTFDAAGGAVRLDRLNDERLIAGQHFWAEELNQVFGFLPYALSGSLGVKRNVFLAVGGFDLSFRHGHEEADFSWRLQIAGYTLGWCKEAVVDYRQREGEWSAARQYFNYAKSSIQLWCKYSDRFPLDPVSFRGSLRVLGYHFARSFRLLSVATRRKQARDSGWAAGIVAGHLFYRFLGTPPTPLTSNWDEY